MSRLLALEGVKIVGLCDPDEKAIKATRQVGKQLQRTPAFSDYKELLAKVKSDAVEISTPHTLHFNQIMASLEAGRHVLCEKPMVCKVAHAQKVIRKVKKTGLVLGVSYQRHTMAPYRYCRELIGSGEAGRVYFVSALQSQNWYRHQVGHKTWRSQMALSGGGQLNDSGSHLLDIILWMTGLQPAEVFAYQDNLGAEVDILTAMSVKFDGGALCNMSVVGHAVNFVEEITMWGEKLTLAIHGNEVWRWKDESREVVSGEGLGPSSEPDTNFIRAIHGEEKVQATAEDGLKVIQLSEAAWRSAAEHKPAQVVR